MLEGLRRKAVAFAVRSALVLGSGLVAVAAASSAQGQPADPGDLLGVGLGKTISDLTCDPSRTLAGPLGALGSGLSALLCNVDQLQYTVHTVYQRPDGSTVARDTPALLLVPTLVNADDDLLPDLQVSLTPMSTSRVVLRIDRALLETAALPVSVEVIANDPTKGDLPRQHIAFGYDARGARAPQSFEADIRIGESATEPGAATLGIQYTTSGTGPYLAVTGGVFDGTTATRTNPVGLRQLYTPMPSRTAVELVVGHHLAMRQTTTAPTVLTADFEDVTAPDEVRAHVVFDKLPASAEVGYEPIAPARRKITYTASAAIDRFTLDYTDKSGTTVNQAATVKANALPTTLTLEQTSPTAGTFDATGGNVGSVEAGYAEGRLPSLLPGATGPYGYVTAGSYAGRIEGLQRATFDAAGPIVIDAQIAARKPFTLKIDQPGLTVDGTLADLPKHARAAIDLSAGKVDYNGFGDTIDSVTFDARRAEPFFEQVRRIQATARQLPPVVTATVLAGQPRKGLDFQASAPIGSLEALLRSDPEGTVPTGLGAGRQGASMIDKTTTFSALGRVYGLKSLRYLASVDATPTVPEAPYELRVDHAAGPFDIRYQQDGSTITGAIEDLPATANLVYTKAAGLVHYDGSAGVERVLLQRQDDQPFAGAAKMLRVTILGLPQPIDITIPRKGVDRTVIEASSPVRQADVLLTSGAEPAPGGDPNDTGESRLYVRTADFCCANQLELAARVNGFKGLSFDDSGSGTDMSLDLAAPQRFKAHAEINRAGDAVATTGLVDLDVDALPSHFDTRLSETTFRWFASAPVGTIKLTASNLPGNKGPGAPHFVEATLAGVPASLQVGLTPSDTGFRSDTGVLGEAEVNISDVRTTYPDRLPADRDTVRLVTTDAGLSQARARVFDVKEARAGTIVDTLSGHLEFGAAPAKPIDVLLDTTRSGPSTQHAEIHVPQPPRHVDIDATVADKVTKLSYDAHGQEFPEFDIRATSRKPSTSVVAVDLTGIDVVVKDLPPALAFCFTDQGQLAGVYCRHDAPDQYVVDPCITCQRTLITQYNDVTVSLETTGATKRVRLERLYSCHGSDPALGEGCLTAGDRFDFLSIQNLLAQRFQFEYADSESVERDDGDPVEDDLLKLYLDTGPDGVNIERLEAWKHGRDKRTIVIANDPGDPVRATHAFAAIDTTPPPSLEAGSGSLTCDHIAIRTQVPVLGTIDVEPLLPICD
jgi:hypothetical protein